jgi:hypothetical protein
MRRAYGLPECDGACLRGGVDMVATEDFDFLPDSGVTADSIAPDPPAWHSHPATKKQIELITDLCDACGYDTAGKRRKYLKGLGFNGATAMLTKGQASAVIRNLFSEVERMEEEAAWMSECWEEEW